MDSSVNLTASAGDALSIASFLSPRSIAVIGAAPAEQRSIRGMLLLVLRRAGFKGRIAPVNPSYREINGLPCYPAIGAVDFSVDLAIVALPADLVCDIVEQCAAAGIRAAIIVSSGFAEQSGDRAKLQSRLSQIARRTGIRICGPNCEGFYNIGGGIAATFSAAAEPSESERTLPHGSRRVAVVAQSGGLGFAILNRGRALGLPFGHVVTTGNECDLTATDFIAHFAADPDTAIIIAYLEEIRDAAGFAAAAELAHANGKAMIAIKIGRSEAGRRAARAHTASDTGSVADHSAMLARAGVIAVGDPDEAVAMALALTTSPVAAGRRVGIVTTAGGAGAVLSDCFDAAGFSVPALSKLLQASLRPTFPAYGSAANPVDVTAQGIFTGGILRTLKILLGCDEVDLIVLVVSLSSERSVALDIEALQTLNAHRSKPVLIYSYTLPSPMAQASLSRAGIAMFAHVGDLLAAMRALARTDHLHGAAAIESELQAP
jgi:acyl-CoA synthetase (NDP forming)